MPRHFVSVNGGKELGSLEWWRHGLGQGGINPAPLSKQVESAIRALSPRLIRVFLQEFFRIYPERGRFDWSRLDPYLESYARTGAKLVAAICIKPKPIYPQVDQRIWRPTDSAEWQKVMAELVTRYSVRKKIVSHWEILNEPDIGEDGGTPHLIPNPEDYYAFYRMTIEPILRVFPTAKVGGPAVTWAGSEPLPGLIERCRRDGTRLDFVSWHRYEDDPSVHAAGVEQVKDRLKAFPGARPEMMVTEWSKSFDPVSIEELAFDSRRAAIIASGILAMLDAGLDWSFYYHLQDQVVRPEDFQPFMSDKGVQNMVRHWNEIPHRFGLFGVDGKVRPQYFVYWMLSRMGDERIVAESDHPHVRVLAGASTSGPRLMLVNWAPAESADRVVTVRFKYIDPGPKRLVVYRIDPQRRWTQTPPTLIPSESRDSETGPTFECQILSPRDSVSLLTLSRM